MAYLPLNARDTMQTDNPNQAIQRPLTSRVRPADVLANPRGMTLVEIMIVVTIMASIMGVVGFFVFGALDEANNQEAKIQIGNYVNMVNSYYTWTDPHTLPDTLEDMTTKKKIAKSIKPDPWGNDYIYRKTGTREFEILSVGQDGTEGTEDDISSKDEE